MGLAAGLAQGRGICVQIRTQLLGFIWAVGSGLGAVAEPAACCASVSTACVQKASELTF